MGILYERCVLAAQTLSAMHQGLDRPGEREGVGRRSGQLGQWRKEQGVACGPLVHRRGSTRVVPETVG